jgi:hypothetical protein
MQEAVTFQHHGSRYPSLVSETCEEDVACIWKEIQELNPRRFIQGSNLFAEMDLGYILGMQVQVYNTAISPVAAYCLISGAVLNFISPT